MRTYGQVTRQCGPNWMYPSQLRVLKGERELRDATADLFFKCHIECRDGPVCVTTHVDRNVELAADEYSIWFGKTHLFFDYTIPEVGFCGGCLCL